MSNPKFHRVLIALSEEELSQTVIEYTKALHLSKENTIALLTVVPPIPSDQLGIDPILGQPAVIVPELADVEEEVAKKFVKNFGHSFPEASAVHTFTRVGNIKQEILAFAQEWNADLIIMGSHGRTGFDHFISGSVSEAVTRKSTCPVLIIPTKCEG